MLKHLAPRFQIKHILKYYIVWLNNNKNTQIKGKESENYYQELKRSQKDRHTYNKNNWKCKYNLYFQLKF